MAAITSTTTKVAEQIRAYVSQGQDAALHAVSVVGDNVQKFVPANLPVLPKLGIPQPTEIVGTAFELTTSLMTAQRDFTLGLLDRVAPPAKATKPSATKAATAAKN